MPLHIGQTCTQFKKSVVEKANSEVLTSKWLDTNAKSCKCGQWIQKEDGCDHMTCRCGAEWCWMCGASYTMIHEIGNTAHDIKCPHYA
jgi:hypothetical protein